MQLCLAFHRASNSRLPMEKTLPISAESSSSSASETKYTGVRKRKWGRYVSEIRLPNSRERIWLGSYDTAEKAARAFDAAMFCLRGRRARFNFPDDPPDIAGGQSLTPAEIQTVAQQYGNSYGCPPPPPPQEDAGPGTASHSLISECAGSVDLVDCSFWDMVDGNGGGQNADFGLFPEPGDLFFPPHFEASNHEEEDVYYDYGSVHSSLWNF